MECCDLLTNSALWGPPLQKFNFKTWEINENPHSLILILHCISVACNDLCLISLEALIWFASWSFTHPHFTVIINSKKVLALSNFVCFFKLILSSTDLNRYWENSVCGGTLIMSLMLSVHLGTDLNIVNDKLQQSSSVMDFFPSCLNFILKTMQFKSPFGNPSITSCWQLSCFGYFFFIFPP